MGRFRRSRALIALLVAILITAALGIPTVADLNLILGSSAQVAYTSGDGVNVRDSLGFSGSIITALPEGAAVTVQDGPVAADDGSYWYQISVDGVTGWIIADYLSLPAGQYGAIANTGGAGVNVRASATTDSSVVTTLQEGTTVSLLGSQEWDGQGNLWTLVGFEGIEGWIVDDFVGPAGSGGSDRSGGATTQAVEQSGWTAYVTGTGGAGLRLREASSTDSATLVGMPEGSAVSVLATEIYSADGTQWWQIDYQGVVGYSAAAYLSDTAPASDGGSEAESSEAAAPATQAAEDDSDGESSGGGDLTPGDNAEVVGTGGAGVNLRYEWGYSSGVATTLSEGAVVAVVDGPMWDGDGEPWYQVEADSVTGWVHGAFLAYTDAAPAAAAEVSAADTSTESAAASTGVGQSIVDEAMRYVGVPYVWGGTTPSGFDCSGFVYYVLNNVVGGLSRSLSVQATSGAYVDPANLQPGDIVFFQNTYTWGLSHNGIYIGDGQFVHAGSTRTGVTISNMWDDYWASRYYTARRVN